MKQNDRVTCCASISLLLYLCYFCLVGTSGTAVLPLVPDDLSQGC